MVLNHVDTEIDFLFLFRILQSASQALGQMAEVTLRAIDIDRLPALVLITRNRSNTEILSVINGNILHANNM